MPEATGSARRKRIEQEVKAYSEQHDLWRATGATLLAVSGGQDSTALALLLSNLGRRARQSLSVAYFDHGLRGVDVGQAEMAFVEELCGRLGLPLTVGRGDVNVLAKRNRLSLEEAAREARYAFLRDVAGQVGARHVATGHTASDQAETVLLNIARGAGLDGLAAMSPRSDWPLPGSDGLQLIRPLLSLSREETLAYCLHVGIEPLRDASNSSADFRRNRVRNELLPLLRTMNPAIEDALTRLATAAREDGAALEALAAAGVETGAGESAVARDWLASRPPGLRKRVLRSALRSAASSLREFSGRHVAALERLVKLGETGDGYDLPHGLRAELERDSLRIFPRAGRPAELPGEVSLSVPGEVQFANLIISVSQQAPSGAEACTEVDREALGSGLIVRSRRPGDRFQPMGMTGTKKLQDLFVDGLVPREQRSRIPLIVSSRGIVWVAGMRLSEWARPKGSSQTMVLSYRPAEAD